jgi:hypothetical protein
MSKGQPVKYMPTPQQRRVHPPYLTPVPSQSSWGVGQEASEVARLFDSLAASIRNTETLASALMFQFDESIAPASYKHVEGKHVGTVKVRYRNVGKLPPRAIPLEDE